MLKRIQEQQIQSLLQDYPAVAILGPRQCGKSTLAKYVIDQLSGKAVYLDMENPEDTARLANPLLFLEANQDKLVCLDEIQLQPDLISVLRSVIDQRARNGQFLLLGSASPELIKHSSESLAGRVAFVEMQPFTLPEIEQNNTGSWESIWLRGGFPRSFLADNDAKSLTWRKNFIQTFLERDLSLWGVGTPAETMHRFWRICAHLHGQQVNYSQLGSSLGVSHTTARSYLDIMRQTYMIHLVGPYYKNLKKRVIKSPKLLLGDTGVLHALLGIQDYNALLGHPVVGFSWEGFVLQNLRAVAQDWEIFYIRTSNQNEIDFLLEKGNRQIAIECKISSAPKLSKGFFNLMDALNIESGFLVGPIKQSFPINDRVEAVPLNTLLSKLQKM